MAAEIAETLIIFTFFEESNMRRFVFAVGGAGKTNRGKTVDSGKFAF